MSSLIRFMYWLARVLGDVQAIRKGRLGDRLRNRMVSRAVRQVTRPLYRR